MNDLIEAGRMLFCSGARDERFREAIDIFLSRNDRREPQRFLARLPSSMRRQRHLAEFVASPEFERSGWTAAQLSHIVPIQTDVDARPCQRSHRMTSYWRSSLWFASWPSALWVSTRQSAPQCGFLQIGDYSAASLASSSAASASPGAVFASRSGNATIRLPEKSACTTTSSFSSK